MKPLVDARCYFGVLLLLLGATSCSSVEPKQLKLPTEAALSRRLHPNEIFPADLDLVVRIDLERVKTALGPSAEQQLSARFGADSLLGHAVRKARVMTIGVRMTDLDHGDHVIVVEGDSQNVDPNKGGLEERASTNAMVRIFSADGKRPRDSTHTLVVLDDRAVAFVSPVEADAVLRVLREGPDDLRGQPVAEGVVSMDLRPRPLPPGLERRFPSIARLIAEVSRVKALLGVADEGLKLEGEIVARTELGADRILKFLQALQDGASNEGPSALLKVLSFERFGAVLNMRANIPIELILSFASRAAAQPETKP